jgi:hypothetical protein
LLWQSRAGPAAQLLSIPGATALLWIVIPKARAIKGLVPRVAATVGAFAAASGILFQQVPRLFPEQPTKMGQAVNLANGRCPTLSALRPIALQPRGYVLTFVDLSPRLITVTHHQAVAGPYHRNQQAILDVMRTFRGTADHARQIVERRAIDYILLCPGMSESTIYRSQASKGFYVQLVKGDVPAWLEPVALPADSPFKMWRVRGSRGFRR